MIAEQPDITEHGRGLLGRLGNIVGVGEPGIAAAELPSVGLILAVWVGVGGAPGNGSGFASRTFRLDSDGSGRLTALGPIEVETAAGRVAAGPGEVTW